IGKSLLVQQLLSATAIGAPFIGLPTEQTNAFGLFCEDPHDQLAHRQFDIDATFAAFPNYDWRYSWESRATDDCVIAEFEYGRMKPLAGGNKQNQGNKRGRMLGANANNAEARLVATNPAAAVSRGKENSRSQFPPFIRALQTQAARRNIAIILVVHSAKA